MINEDRYVWIHQTVLEKLVLFTNCLQMIFLDVVLDVVRIEECCIAVRAEMSLTLQHFTVEFLMFVES